jgi:hypothetical protein
MKIWDKILKASAVLGAVIFLCSSIFGGYSFLNRKAVEKERKTQHEITLERTVNKLIKSDSVTIAMIDTLLVHQGILMYKIEENTKGTKAVISGFKKHLKATDRLEELLNFYEF